MKKRLEDLLVCPACKEPFEVKVFAQEDDSIVEGLLTSNCGKTYPIVNAIPRILDNTLHINRDRGDIRVEKTRESFGYQWKNFSKIIDEFKDNLLNYIHPKNRNFFKGKLGLDAGCGMGRHIYYASKFGANMVGIDFSNAIEVAYQNVGRCPNIDLVQCDIYNLPFRPNSFDFVYSIGVLHHLPDPENGFQNLCKLTKSSISIWVYSKKRITVNFLLERLRRITTRIPHKVLNKICVIISFFEWWFFIQPYKVMKKVPVFGRIVNKIAPPRVKLYSRYPFFVCHTDWFDRLSAPIRFYYNQKDLEGWCRQASLKNVVISPTGLYGWRLYGEKA